MNERAEPASNFQERTQTPASGLVMLLVAFLLAAASIWVLAESLPVESVPGIVGGLAGALATVLVFVGLFVVNPNEAKVLQLFGRYVGTVRRPGLAWANPFFGKRRVSLRVRNFETGKLKVNDARGNPIEIACVVVWKVTDTAETLFNVDDFTNFVHVQSEAALRGMATLYPYEAFEGEGISLSRNTAEISDQLRSEVQKRLAEAGISVIEARISHLAYSPEIASAMLQRQQATAVVAARQKIVEGAVGMVEAALDKLKEGDIIELDDERKATMVSNLLVVLCGDRSPQPVVNAGSLYQ
jgi:regulator of protease activity HflC (stomatin/prohibitin superfamily)